MGVKSLADVSNIDRMAALSGCLSPCIGQVRGSNLFGSIDQLHGRHAMQIKFPSVIMSRGFYAAMRTINAK